MVEQVLEKGGFPVHSVQLVRKNMQYQLCCGFVEVATEEVAQGLVEAFIGVWVPVLSRKPLVMELAVPRMKSIAVQDPYLAHDRQACMWFLI